MYKSLSNELYNLNRRNKRFSDDEVSELPSSSIEALYKRQDNKELLQQCLAVMESEKDPILLIVYQLILQGKSDKQIAVELGMPVQKVLNKHRLVIDHLRKYFNKENKK